MQQQSEKNEVRLCLLASLLTWLRVL